MDDIVGAWLARHAADPVDEPGETLIGLAVEARLCVDPVPTAWPSTCSPPRCTAARL
ncbi:hypothetical protein [Streptomyces justiciae]|uniref:hypothetical protein n=1 Tax=Streptomyces justiciae TaxID=2780140 RepID=UPI00187EF705|nr:hypothetical protein [Streptomyces justiciae]MBE8475999.1 hypothetical protein [Streptomyces justiciae]MCW8382664.1 hypothetical protein [Streptomyces justiciae]